jgi:hypothetical protein
MIALDGTPTVPSFCVISVLLADMVVESTFATKAKQGDVGL